MQSIFVCNTAGDSLSEINLTDYSSKKYPLDLGEKPVGPHSLICYHNKLIISNCYNNSISIFSLNDKIEKENMYIGSHPQDMCVLGNMLYVVCCDSNSVVAADLEAKEIITSIPVSEYPHNIEVDGVNKIAYVSNFNSNSISIIDLDKNVVKSVIKTYENPTKIFLSKDKRMLYLCESYFGKEIEGYVSIISTETKKVIKRIRVGMEPADFVIDDNKVYVTNSGEGTLSIIDLNKGREVKKIYIGGMVSSIIKVGNDIFIGDYMNGRVVKVNLKERIIKNITVGKEPNAMILVDYLL